MLSLLEANIVGEPDPTEDEDPSASSSSGSNDGGGGGGLEGLVLLAAEVNASIDHDQHAS